jgi:hypothetical protein
MRKVISKLCQPASGNPSLFANPHPAKLPSGLRIAGLFPMQLPYKIIEKMHLVPEKSDSVTNLFCSYSIQSRECIFSICLRVTASMIRSHRLRRCNRLFSYSFYSSSQLFFSSTMNGISHGVHRSAVTEGECLLSLSRTRMISSFNRQWRLQE